MIDRKATEEEALRNCTKLEKTSSLISIHSQDEQDFINKLATPFNNISNVAWVGLKYQQVNKSYLWQDDFSNADYNNWADDAVKDGTEPCVQMSLIKSNLGKWTDESCKKTALIICQKNQVITLDVLRHAVESVETKYEKDLASKIPINFIYTQFPYQLTPQGLWPNMKWMEVTNQYSGLFFRAEGGGSLAFEKVQDAKMAMVFETEEEKLSDTFEEFYVTGTNATTTSTTPRISNTTTSPKDKVITPKSTAVKIWKRVG